MSLYVITSIRFPFWNGKDRYTMEYCPSLRTWFVFKNDDTQGCIYEKKLSKPVRKKDINFETAEEFMYEFIESITLIK